MRFIYPPNSLFKTHGCGSSPAEIQRMSPKQALRRVLAVPLRLPVPPDLSPCPLRFRRGTSGFRALGAGARASSPHAARRRAGGGEALRSEVPAPRVRPPRRPRRAHEAGADRPGPWGRILAAELPAEP